jgi:hypothetical protein
MVKYRYEIIKSLIITSFMRDVEFKLEYFWKLRNWHKKASEFNKKINLFTFLYDL